MNNARKRAKTLKGSEKCTESNDIRLKCNVQHAPNGGAAAGAWDGGCKRGGSRALALGGSGSMSVGGGCKAAARRLLRRFSIGLFVYLRLGELR